MTDPEDVFQPPSSLQEMLDDAVLHLTGVELTVDGEETVLSRVHQPFAALRAGVLEIRLDPLIAGAALRTPDASPSSRGEGWVRFAPQRLDHYAVDRVGAWLGYAWRHALG